MAYSNATAADLKAAFTKFAAVADATVEFWLERARRAVDQTWTEGDYAMGQMLLACHLMTLEGIGTGAEAEANANGLGEYKTVKSGALSLERFDNGSKGSASAYDGTSYGKRFKALARINIGGPRVTPTGSIPEYDGPNRVWGT